MARQRAPLSKVPMSARSARRNSLSIEAPHALPCWRPGASSSGMAPSHQVRSNHLLPTAAGAIVSRRG